MRRVIKCEDPMRMGGLICMFVFAKFLAGNSQTSINNGGKPDYNRWPLAFLGGFSNAVDPYTTGYSTNLLNISNVQLGTRFMANRRVGLKLDAGYDLVKNDNPWKENSSLPFQGVAPERIETTCFGSTKPVASNETEEGRQKIIVG